MVIKKYIAAYLSTFILSYIPLFMKKSLPFIGLLALMSCSKSNQTDNSPDLNSGKKIAVNFGLSGFTQTVSNKSQPTVNSLKITDGAPLLNTSVSKLMLVIYDKNGNQVDRFEQTRNETNKTFKIADDKRVATSDANGFGLITDQLVAGTYTVVAFGTAINGSLNRKNEGVIDANNPKAYPVETLANAKYWSDYDFGNDEIYYYKGSLTVVDVNAPTQPIELKHIVGELTVAVTDDLPKSAVKASLIIRNEAASFRISTSAPEDKFDSNITAVPFNLIDLGPKLTVTTSVLNTVTPVTAEIKVYDINNKVIASKSITNITVPVGKLVTLTGALFTGYTNPTSTITVSGDGAFTQGETIHF
jgi:hypothetical protein